MSYTPHEWTTDETITAAKLNNLETGVQEAAQSGGGSNIMMVHINNDTLDKTFKEIWDALEAETPVYLTCFYGAATDYESTRWTCPITQAYKYNQDYNVIAVRSITSFGSGPTALWFRASSLTGYPVFNAQYYPSNRSNSGVLVW